MKFFGECSFYELFEKVNPEIPQESKHQKALMRLWDKNKGCFVKNCV